MVAYLIRRLLYSIPIVFGIVVITFVLFFIANTPEHMARRTLGEKASPEAVEQWIREHGYNFPRFYNKDEEGLAKFTATLFCQKAARVMIFDLGRSDASDRDIATEIRRRVLPTMAIALPTFFMGMAVYITMSLIIAFCRGTYLDRWGTIVTVLMMSISSLFYIIGGQFLFAKWLHLFPISGFDWGENMIKFTFLPVLIGILASIGTNVRFYRTVMLEEIGRDYVRTARAKGLGEGVVLFRHVLKNAMIPILTNAVMAIPFLFMGSLIMESFFSIPGLGSMTIDAIHANDFAVVRSMSYIGGLLYVIALLLTDISYTLADPRISLGSGDTRSLYGQPSGLDILKILVSFAVLAGAAVGVFRAAGWLGGLDVRIPIVTNLAVLLTVGGFIAFLVHAKGSDLWRNAWAQVRTKRVAMISLFILCIYVTIGLLDSVTWRDIERKGQTGEDGKQTRRVLSEPRSVLDRICKPLTDKTEKTYSAPMADTLFVKEAVEVEVDGKLSVQRKYPELDHPRSHVFGTDKTGGDVLFITLKSIRTGLIVGGLTTLIAVPFAIFFGVLAGFFGGRIDDIVQYVYTTLSSIPWVLLVVCFVLVFGRGLTQICIVMGITGWVPLCRVLRGEAMKLREKEYVQAALALGVSKYRVLAKHIVPNLMHLVLISIVLRFSWLVLAEAVLSYIGVGVGPGTHSWGSMINQARAELGRDPVVWWNLIAAFITMFALVLPANLFADAMRDALDPSLRVRE